MADRKIAAADLQPGMRVDLEGDAYADPHGADVGFQFEYVEVVSVERETPDCVLVGFEGVNPVGFPPGHLVTVAEE